MQIVKPSVDEVQRYGTAQCMARPGAFRFKPTAYVAPPVTYQSVLGAKLLEYWTAKDTAKIAGTTTMTGWTGSKLGVLLSPFNTTPYSADGTNFASLKVLNVTNGAINSMRNLSTSIGTSATVLTCILVGRNRTANSSDTCPMMTYSSNNYVGWYTYSSSNAVPNNIAGYRYATSGVSAAYANSTDQLPHMNEFGFTSTTGLFTYRDGVALNNPTTSGYPTGPTGQITNVQIGGDSNWFAIGSNWAIAMVMLIDGPMTSTERAAVYSIARTDFNLP